MILFRKMFMRSPTANERIWDIKEHLDQLADELNAQTSEFDKEIRELKDRIAELEGRE